MISSMRALAVASALLLSAAAFAAERFPGPEWERTTPEAAGWSRVKLADARAYSEAIGSTAVMVIHHGLVVAEWGDTAISTNLHSARKSLLSALIGVAVAEGKIDLADTMAKLGIDDNPPALTPEEKAATVGDLIKARSGIYHPALYETAGMAARRPPRGSHPPNTFWYYNNWDFNALGTIYERAEGKSIFAALDERIARPIGMQDWGPAYGSYYRGPDSVHPAYVTRMSARDLARFGLLFLNEGRWGDRQVVPAAWVRESTRSYSSTGSGTRDGYGYMWWTGPSVAPAGSFFAAGNGGQYAFVVPARDLVVVHRVNTDGRARDVGGSKVVPLLRRILDAAPG